jgi:hypothetical protein
MNLDNELRLFFSDRKKLKQIDELHRLLFQSLQALQTEFPDAIRKTLDEVGAKRSGVWKRRDGVPLGRNGKPLNQAQIGFVYARPSAKWPKDIWIHFGHYPNLFNEPWIGVYTLAADEKSFRRLHEVLEPLLENAQENEFADNDPYPIWKGMEDWPKRRAANRVQDDASLIGLERMLDEGERGAVSCITERIVRILDALQD